MKFSDVYDIIDDPVDYFDFPACMISFGKSLKSSVLSVCDNKIFLRRYGKTVTVISYLCSSDELKRVLNNFISNGTKVKFLNYVNKEMDAFKKSKYGNEYYIFGDFDFDFGFMKSKSRSKIGNKMRHAERDYEMDEFSKDEFYDLFYDWYESAKKRHFMVTKGHYLAYMKMFFENKFPNVFVIGFRRKSDGLLYGVSGYEIFKGKAQINIMKHRIGDNNFPKYFWINSLKQIVSHKVSKVFCGTTADELKSEMGMSSDISYKLRL